MKKYLKKYSKLIFISTAAFIILFSGDNLSAQENAEIQALRIGHTLIFLPPLKEDPNNIDGHIDITIQIPPLGNSPQRAALIFYLREKNGRQVPLLVSIPGVEKEGNTLNLRNVDPAIGAEVDVSLKLGNSLIKKLRGRYNKPVKFKLYVELREPFQQTYFLRNVKILDIHPKYK